METASGVTAGLGRPGLGGVLAMMAAAIAIGLMIANPHRSAATSTAAPPSPAATTPSIGPSPFAPKAVSEDELRNLTAQLGRPVYWAGAQEGQRYEISQLPGGKVVIRYLPPGVDAGARQPLRTITTVSVPNAFLAVRAVAQEARAVSHGLPGGGLAVFRVSAPGNVFLSIPGDDRQRVELFDPSPTEAQQLVHSGAIQAVR